MSQRSHKTEIYFTRATLNQIEKWVNHFSSQPQYVKPEPLLDPISASMSIYFDCGNLTDTTKNIQSFLITTDPRLFKDIIVQMMAVKPTSTDVERSFSLSGLILAPRRRKLNEETLDDIVVLNRFYKSK